RDTTRAPPSSRRGEAHPSDSQGASRASHVVGSRLSGFPRLPGAGPSSWTNATSRVAARYLGRRVWDMGRNRVVPSGRLLTRCQPGRPERPPERPWETTLRQTIEIARRCGARDPDDTVNVGDLPAGDQDRRDGPVRILPLRPSAEPAGPAGPKTPAQ